MYRLTRAEKVANGVIRHTVETQAGVETFRYHGVRFALVWPTAKSPAYFCGAGSEVFDAQLDAMEGPIIKVFVEYENQSLALDAFFDRLTDDMTASLAEVVYCDLTREDFRETIYSYLDRRGLRSINVQQAPYADFTLRLGKVADLDKAGNLIVAKDSPLYGDLRGISRLDLEDSPEVRFFRLNCLSMLAAGFQKFPARPPLQLKNIVNLRGGKGPGWML